VLWLGHGQTHHTCVKPPLACTVRKTNTNMPDLNAAAGQSLQYVSPGQSNNFSIKAAASTP
jgi:hypothetical protein